MGFSAGGHLASMMGLSKNNSVKDFFMPGPINHSALKE
jgi:acetyl esterase/lipase